MSQLNLKKVADLFNSKAGEYEEVRQAAIQEIASIKRMMTIYAEAGDYTLVEFVPKEYLQHLEEFFSELVNLERVKVKIEPNPVSAGTVLVTFDWLDDVRATLTVLK